MSKINFFGVIVLTVKINRNLKIKTIKMNKQIGQIKKLLILKYRNN